MDAIRRMLFFVNCYEQNTTRYKVLVLLLQNLHKVVEMTIQEVADLCFVSQSTVSRLLQDMGFANYAVFRAEVTQALQLDSVRAEEKPDLRAGSVEQTYNRFIAAINSIYTPAFLQQIEGIAERMKAAEKVCILLWSRKEYLDLQRELFLDGKRITVHDVAELAPPYVADLKGGDVFITCIANEAEYLVKRSMLQKAQGRGVVVAVLAEERFQRRGNWAYRLPIWPDATSSSLWSEVVSKVLLAAYKVA